MTSRASHSATLPAGPGARPAVGEIGAWLDVRPPEARPSAPRYRVAILGAGRNIRGHLPSAIVDVGQMLPVPA